VSAPNENANFAIAECPSRAVGTMRAIIYASFPHYGVQYMLALKQVCYGV